ncbi:S-methyl-5-thioribose-1-phosphate isomerase, partial [Myxococcota bacterium]|nr:S-methyl-5-thioribose-1-phosphate isomerase [Myxococcota bacterium]
MIRPFFLENGELLVLDQRLLPREERWLCVRDCEGAADVITTMAVRGAPAIGCVAAWGMAFAARDLAARD